VTKLVRFFLSHPEGAPRSVILIRLATGRVVSTRGLLEFTDPDLAAALRRCTPADG
jgi:hypothetical protein